METLLQQMEERMEKEELNKETFMWNFTKKWELRYRIVGKGRNYGVCMVQ